MVVFIHATLPTIHISTSGLTFYHLLSVHVVLTKKNLWTWSQIEFPGNGSISELHSLQLGGIWRRRCRADYLAGTPLIGTECQAELFESMPIAQPDDVQNVFDALQNNFYCLLVFASPLKLMMQCPSPIWCSLISTKFGKNWSPVCGGELVMLRWNICSIQARGAASLAPMDNNGHGMARIAGFPSQGGGKKSDRTDHWL